MTKSQLIRENVIQAWIQASKILKFKIETPFQLKCYNGQFECIAFLPAFGSPKGMVIDGISEPAFESTPGLSEAAAEKGIFYSSVNMEKYSNYSEDVFKEALLDWGYFGDAKPYWIK